MSPIKIVAMALIVAGVLGLIYGGFSYNQDTTKAKLGPIALNHHERTVLSAAQ